MSWLDKYDSSSHNKSNEQSEHQYTIDDARAEVNKHPGMSAKSVFYLLCKQKGVDPNGPINTIMKMMSGGGK